MGPNLPDFGIDPALLAGAAPPPQPLDLLGAAIAALQASGAQPQSPPVPSLFGTGPHDTDLEALPPEPALADPYASTPTAQYDASGKQIHGVQLPPGSVTVTGQQRMPTPGQDAARQHAIDVADPNVPLRPDDVMGQTSREGMALASAGDARSNQATAEYNAETARADRVVRATEQGVAEQARLDQLYQQGRMAAEAKADADTGAWMQKYTEMAAQEPNPGRWFENQGTVGKALWGLGLLFGAANTAITPGAQNVILGMVRQNIRDDMAEQRARLDKSLAALKMQGQVVDQRNLRNLTDLTDDHTMELGRLAALRQAYIARAQAPGSQDLQAGLAAADTWFADETLKVATSRRQSAVEMENARLQRQFQAGQNSLNRKLQFDMQTREIAKDYDLAALSASAKLKGEDAHKGEVRISPQAGALVVDAKTGKPVGDAGDEGALWINEKLEPAKVQGMITAASQEAADLQQLYSALNDESSWASIIAGTNVEAQQALARLQKSRAAEAGGLGRMTDKDMEIVVKDIQGLGNGNALDRTRLAAMKSEVLGAVQRTMETHKKEVDNRLSSYAPPGTRIDWSPKNLAPTEMKALTPDEQIAQLGGTPKARPLARNPEELKQQRERGVDPRLTGPQAAGQYSTAVQNLEASMYGSSPAHIKALAEAALNTVTPRQADPWNPDAALGGGKPNKGSEFARDAYIPSVVQPALEEAEKREKALVQALANGAVGKGFASDIASHLPGTSATDRWKQHKPVLPTRDEVKSYAATEYEFTNLDDTDVDHIIDEVEKALGRKGK